VFNSDGTSGDTATKLQEIIDNAADDLITLPVKQFGFSEAVIMMELNAPLNPQLN